MRNVIEKLVIRVFVMSLKTFHLGMVDVIRKKLYVFVTSLKNCYLGMGDLNWCLIRQFSRL